MNSDEIIRMAREIGLGTVLCHNSIDGDRVWIGGADWHDELELFYHAAYAAGAAAEREACAKVVIDMVDNGQGVVDRITAAIRARTS